MTYPNPLTTVTRLDPRLFAVDVSLDIVSYDGYYVGSPTLGSKILLKLLINANDVTVYGTFDPTANTVSYYPAHGSYVPSINDQVIVVTGI